MKQGSAASKLNRSKNKARGKNRRRLLVSAFLADAPNLDLYSALHNLMWYAVECLNSLPSMTGKNKIMAEHFFKSVKLLSAREKECAAGLDQQSNKLFLRFVDEARATETLLRSFLETTKPTDDDTTLIPRSAAGEIAAKATYLQWLLICLSREMRIPFGPGASPPSPDRNKR